MSITLMSLAFKSNLPKVDIKEGEGTHTVKPSTSKFVLVALADHANDEGKGAYPSLDTLSNKTSLERKTVARALDALELLGIIKCVGISEYNTDNYTIFEEVLKSHVTLGKKIGDLREEKTLPESHKSSLIQSSNKQDESSKPKEPKTNADAFIGFEQLKQVTRTHNGENDEALKAFERDMRVSGSWSWYPSKTSNESEWREFRKLVCEIYSKDPQGFAKYHSYRLTDFAKGTKTNSAIKSNPAIFAESYNDFLINTGGNSNTTTKEEGKGFYA